MRSHVRFGKNTSIARLGQGLKEGNGARTVSRRSAGRYSGSLQSPRLEDLGLSSMFITWQLCDLGKRHNYSELSFLFSPHHPLFLSDDDVKMYMKTL